MENESTSVAVPQPKKAFLRRGEGTERRVFASRYRDAAREKRLENQQRAMERQTERFSEQTGIDLRGPPGTTPSAPVSESPAQKPASKGTACAFEFPLADGAPQFAVVEDDDASTALPKPFGEGACVDGSCRVESTERDDEGAPVEDGGLSRAREEAWLERQRRHEEEQWMEAMELHEFEQLEKQIVEETRSRLNKAEGEIRKKQVTFQEHRLEKQPSFQLPRNSPPPSVQPPAPSMSPKNVQKLKSISAARGKKLSAASKKASGKPRPAKSPSTTLSAKRPSSKPAAADRDFVVDSTFLDRLLEKDFNSNPDQTLVEDRPSDDLFEERLRLQSMQDDFENEKREWQRKQQDSVAQFETMKAEQFKKIKRERRVLEQQSKALLKLPNKKERSEIESLEALLETERKEGRSREARHKLTVERLKDQIQQLQIHSQELQDEIKWFEERQVKKLDPQTNPSRSTMTSPPPRFETGVQTESIRISGPIDPPVLSLDRQQLGVTDEAFLNSQERNKWAVQLENPFYSESTAQEWQTKLETPPLAALPEPKPSKAQLMETPIQAPWMATPFGWPNMNRDSYRISDSQFQDSRLCQPGYDGPISGSFDFSRSSAREIPPYEPLCRPPCSSLPQFQQLPPQPGFIDTFGERSSWQYPGYMAHGVSTGQTMPPFANRMDSSLYRDPGHLETLHPSQPTLISRGFPVDPSAALTPARSPEAQEHLPNFRISGADHLPHAEVACQTISNASAVDQSIKQKPSSTKKTSGTETRREQTPVRSLARDQAPRRLESSHKKTVQSESSRKEPSPDVSQFDNGTIKQTYPDGRVVVWFSNSDVKHVHPCGRVEYFYADLSTWQVTHTSNVDIFYFDIGQVEAHKANGDKDIIFPDGTARKVYPDGTEKEVTMEDVAPELKRPKPEIPPNPPERVAAKTPFRH